MKRFELWVWLGCIAWLVLQQTAFGDEVHNDYGFESSPRPNIVLFLVDDMGLMDTSVPFLTDDKGRPKPYPLNQFYRTPGLERLARQGIRFQNFYAMSDCSPTRLSIMTGQNSARHRTTNWINPFKNNCGAQGPPDFPGDPSRNVQLKLGSDE